MPHASPPRAGFFVPTGTTGADPFTRTYSLSCAVGSIVPVGTSSSTRFSTDCASVRSKKNPPCYHGGFFTFQSSADLRQRQIRTSASSADVSVSLLWSSQSLWPSHDGRSRRKRSSLWCACSKSSRPRYHSLWP